MKKQIIVTILLFASLIHTPKTNTIPDLFTAKNGKRLCTYVALPLGTFFFGSAWGILNTLDYFDNIQTRTALESKHTIDVTVNLLIRCGLGLIVVSAAGTSLFDRRIQANKKYKKELLAKELFATEKKSEPQDLNK